MFDLETDRRCNEGDAGSFSLTWGITTNCSNNRDIRCHIFCCGPRSDNYLADI